MRLRRSGECCASKLLLQLLPGLMEVIKGNKTVRKAYSILVKQEDRYILQTLKYIKGHCVLLN
jgi:hypothetical protein